ncbi:MAG: hypothetical protein IJX47_09390 [Clostridia bacterium]|nr:hypothetical protein [Clostridia bacterium]
MDELTVIAENLADADRLLADVLKLRRSHLADLAECLRKRMEGGEEQEQTLTTLYSEFEERQEGRTPADTMLRATSLLTRLELCRALSDQDSGQGVPLYRSAHPVIAYFQNPYAGRVLHSVTDLLGGGEATDAEDYSDACEGTAEGRYDFCVLPIESARDGVMNRFVQLIDRYGLFTVLVCHLELSEEEHIRFALLSASPCRLVGADRLKLRVVPGEEQLWELLFACQAFGARPEGCRTLPGAEAVTYELTLRVQNADVTALTYYLELGWSRSTVTGFYPELILPAEAERELLY